jgi:hypothetical protein
MVILIQQKRAPLMLGCETGILQEVVVTKYEVIHLVTEDKEDCPINVTNNNENDRSLFVLHKQPECWKLS